MIKIELVEIKEGLMKEPNVKLVSFTREPLKVVCWSFMNMHNPIPDNLDDFDMPTEEMEELFKVIAKQPHTTVFEFVNTVWYLGNVSRAFQQQLTRTRAAAYSIQSLRVVGMNDFADEEKYLIPPTIRSNGLEEEYKSIMKFLQDKYNELCKKGVRTEDARNILPLAVHSPITMAINLRSLYHMLELRLCYNAQEEYRTVAEKMVEEMKTKMGEIFVMPIKRPCERYAELIGEAVCPSPVPCELAKFYNYKLLINEDVSKWIKG